MRRKMILILSAVAAAVMTTQTEAGESEFGRCCFVATCPADIFVDGETNQLDLIRLIDAWGTDDAAADIRDDGVVDVFDLMMLLEDFGCVEGEAACATNTQAQCVALDGQWTPRVSCSEEACPIPPPINDECGLFTPKIFFGETPIDLTGATASDFAVDSCDDMHQDLWYVTFSVCTGFLIIDTNGGADVATRIAVYEGEFCPSAPGVGAELVGCGDGNGDVTVPVITAEIYIIRVGTPDVDTPTGPDVLNLTYTECK